MKLGIMQPYFFPYIGYFQLMNVVDEFVIYDNIEYTKKGWINRNRILLNGKASYITLPLKKDSDYLDIGKRCLADSWSSDRNKIINKITAAYKKSPFFDSVFPFIEKIVLSDKINLFKFIANSLQIIKDYLEIKTPLIASSTIPIDHSLKAEKKVLAICQAKKADTYINPIGGTELYSKDDFKKSGVDLHFIQLKDFEYPQFANEFIPFLSIIDVMMFNSKENVKNMLNSYILN
ncbi:MAG: WbqC family protein [Candidatus Rickettsiella isopodorum]|nr:WbqC family protein [Candidatus Rickettsiella isopodorum]MDD5342157.1 WbqC family protein [Patescibacteria group bacterium]